MRIIADFHIHSRYSRAVSRELVPGKLLEWAQYKGIELMGTGDFTHPLWLKELEDTLEPVEDGLFCLKAQDSRFKIQDSQKFQPVRFILTAEVASIFTQGGKMRRMHTLLVAPSFAAVRRLNRELANIGNLTSDGRPILGLSAKELARIAFHIDPTIMVIPAHAWTPWFSVFGSKSGFDSLEECFEEFAPEIFAIETGLSSDPEMNWRLSSLDRVALISCSDAHSLPNLGREATVFELDHLSFVSIRDALKSKQPHALLGTIEFFPEEGKYHYDGEATHRVVWSPTETKAHHYRCPTCQKSVTVGVLHRVDDLADRPTGYQPAGMPWSKHIVPLAEIISDAFGVGKASKKVLSEYWKLIHALGSEFSILLDLDLAEISRVAQPLVVEGLRRVRAGKLAKVSPGYDGVYGTIRVFTETERLSRQSSLF